MTPHKILFTGTMDAGKTTALAALLETPPITTAVRTNPVLLDPTGAIVGMDYGDLTLASGEHLRLYGIPGQRRFDFMWKELIDRALGLVILVDNSRADPLADAAIYLENFSELIGSTACVIGVGRMQEGVGPSLDAYAELLHKRELIFPVVRTDVRDRQDVLRLMDLLLVQLENKP